jgi:Uma2 family endonuclease
VTRATTRLLFAPGCGFRAGQASLVLDVGFKLYWGPMGLAQRIADHDEPSVEDTILLLPNATWSDYQRHMEMRGDKSAPRIAFLEGTIEIVSPSRTHEEVKSLIGCLVELWCLEKNIEFQTLGSWTLEKKEVERGVEPDECYVFGREKSVARPDLAIEVVWTSGGLNKLEIYRKLDVKEVWFWRRGSITIHVLRDETYEQVSSSVALPGIDVVELAAFLDRPSTSQAMRDYREQIRARG